MATDQSFADFIVDQLQEAGSVRYRRMFGEYAVYLDEKVIMLLCDNQVFVKVTEPGRAFIGNVVEAPAYPGARPSFLVDRIDQAKWLCRLARITADALPVPKKKKTVKTRVKKIS